MEANKNEIASVVKGGSLRIQVSLQRTWTGARQRDPATGTPTPSGLTISVKTTPDVEDFMKNVGGGVVQDVTSYGRYWSPVDRPSLFIYTIPAMTLPRSEDGSHIKIDGPGSLIMSADSNGFSIVNLSFLRLAGISEGIGVSFNVRGIYSLTSIKEMKDKIAVATKKFYIEYVRPIDCTVQISTQELHL